MIGKIGCVRHRARSGKASSIFSEGRMSLRLDERGPRSSTVFPVKNELGGVSTF